MKPTQILVIQLVDKSGNPLLIANTYTDLLFSIHGNYCYGFRFGPTNNEGKLSITYHDVERKRALDAKFNLMDYNTPLDKCDDILRIRIPSGDELKKAYEWQAKSLADGPSDDAKRWLSAANARIKANEFPVKLVELVTTALVPCSIE